MKEREEGRTRKKKEKRRLSSSPPLTPHPTPLALKHPLVPARSEEKKTTSSLCSKGSRPAP